MTKFLSRIVALLLTFSLVQEPCLAAAMGSVGADLVPACRTGRSARKFASGQAQGLPLQFPFTSQALAGRNVSASFGPGGLEDTPVHREILEAETSQLRAANDQPRINMQPAFTVIPPLAYYENGDTENKKFEIGKLVPLSDGRTAVIGNRSRFVHITDLRRQNELYKIEASRYASDVAISRNGSHMAVGVGYWMHFVDVTEDGEIIEDKIVMPGETKLGKVVTSEDGATIVATSTVEPYELDSKFSAVVIQRQRVTAVIYGKKKEKMCLSGDGHRLFTFADNGRVSSWEIPPEEESPRRLPLVIVAPVNSFYPGSLKDPGPRLLDMATNETGKILITLSEDLVLRIYNADHPHDKENPTASLSGSPISHTGSQDDGPVVVTLSRDGHQAATGHRNGDVRIWDLESRAQTAVLRCNKGGQSSPIQSVMISGDGLVAAANAEGHWAWNVSTLTQPQPQLALLKAIADLIRLGRLPLLSVSRIPGTPTLIALSTTGDDPNVPKRRHRNRRKPQDSPLGQRIINLRKRVRLSRSAAAAHLRLSYDTIEHLEHGETTDFKDPRRWKDLADLLRVDVFVLLTNLSRTEAVAELSSWEDRARLLCQAEGVLFSQLRSKWDQEVSQIIEPPSSTAMAQSPPATWLIEVDHIRRGSSPSPLFSHWLASRLKSTPEELFGKQLLCAPPYVFERPVAFKGKFLAKMGSDPEVIFRSILQDLGPQGLWQKLEQGLLTVQDYARSLYSRNISLATLYRGFGKLVDELDLFEVHPHPHLHKGRAYGLTEKGRLQAAA